MGVSRNGFGESYGREQILAQVEHSDPSMVGFFGEKIEDAFIMAGFFHEIVLDSPSGWTVPSL